MIEFDSSFHLLKVSGNSNVKSAIECVDWTAWYPGEISLRVITTNFVSLI
jgi:hypothetical protein